MDQEQGSNDFPFEPTGVLWRDLATLRALAVGEGWSTDKLLAASDKIIAKHEARPA